MDSLLDDRRTKSVGQCGKGKKASNSGGWCLRAVPEVAYELNGITVHLTKGHIVSHPGICRVLKEMIVEEQITTMSDLGAGLGQYGGCVSSSVQQFYSYDGAANVEAHTQQLVKYVDFTLPLHLPTTDWAIPFEVGEHVPSKYEGMFVRNLHATNCRGIVLSWATFKQRGGTSHINLHDNDHLKQSFAELGYVHDDAMQERFRKATPGVFFETSLMVFRRKVAVC